jgi:hypothetical protein
MKTITDWGEWFADQSWPYEFELFADRKIFDSVNRNDALSLCGMRYRGPWSPSDWVKADLIKTIQRSDKEKVLQIDESLRGTWLYIDNDVNAALSDAISSFIHKEELQSQCSLGKGI